MSYNPSAPPTYNDVVEKQQSNNMNPPMGFQSTPSNSAQYNYSQVPLNQPPIQMQPQPQIIVVQGGPMMFGPCASRLTCPSCQQNTVTRVDHTNSATTHIIAALLCFMGCCCFAPIPYCIDSCKNSVHYCGECGSYLGTYTNNANNNRRY